MELPITKFYLLL